MLQSKLQCGSNSSMLVCHCPTSLPLFRAGVSLSLDSQNGLLRLLAWTGVGNRTSTSTSAEQCTGQEEQGSEGVVDSSEREDSKAPADLSGLGNDDSKMLEWSWRWCTIEVELSEMEMGITIDVGV